MKTWVRGKNVRWNPFYFSFEIPGRRRKKRNRTLRTANRVLLPKQSPSVVNFGENSSFEVGRTLVLFLTLALRHFYLLKLAYFFFFFFGCSCSTSSPVSIKSADEARLYGGGPLPNEKKKSCICRCQRAV